MSEYERLYMELYKAQEKAIKILKDALIDADIMYYNMLSEAKNKNNSDVQNPETSDANDETPG